MGEVVTIQSLRDARFDGAWAARQKRLAGLYCGKGHNIVERDASHIGKWRACTRCGLIEVGE